MNYNLPQISYSCECVVSKDFEKIIPYSNFPQNLFGNRIHKPPFSYYLKMKLIIFETLIPHFHGIISKNYATTQVCNVVIIQLFLNHVN